MCWIYQNRGRIHQSRLASYSMSGEPSNETLKSMIDDIRRDSETRHADYKEERKEIKIMLQEINVSLKKLSEDHASTKENLASLLTWSVEAKKAIESNSSNIGQLQRKQWIVIGGAAVVLACGVWVLTLWEKNLRRDILEENGKQTYEVFNKVYDERVDKTLKAN